MYLESRMLFLYVETPLHAGAGSGVEAIDLPIQRERTTGYPMVQAPGIKGALRSECPTGTQEQKREVAVIFGPDPQDAADNPRHAGAFSPSDARLLLFPVRSLKGVFAWTTSLDVLQRWRREARAAGIDVPSLPQREPHGNEKDGVYCYTSGQGAVVDNEVVLEEFAYQVEEEKNVGELAGWLANNALPQTASNDDPYAWWRRELKEKLIILPNDDFRDFTHHATEVLTRVRLDPDTKSVVSGALWTEEHLPTDTLLYVPVRATRFRCDKETLEQLSNGWRKLNPYEQAKKVLDWVASPTHIPHRLQLGGDETVGRGIVVLRWLNGGK